MKTAVLIFGLGLAALLLPAQMAVAEAPDVAEIVAKANHTVFYQGPDQKARVDMRIIDKQGRIRKRQLTLLRRNFGDADGEQKYYVYFSKPADVKKLVFMAWKNIGRDDDRWLYLPALDLVKRISASDGRTSFVGSNFFYEDVSGRETEEDTHTLLSEDGDFFVVESKPKRAGDVEFSSYKNWVDKSTYLPMKTEYRDKAGNLHRVYTAVTVEVIGGFPTVVDAIMENKITGGRTELHYSDVVYAVGLPKNIYTERFLRKLPRKYLK